MAKAFKNYHQHTGYCAAAHASEDDKSDKTSHKKDDLNLKASVESFSIWKLPKDGDEGIKLPAGETAATEYVEEQHNGEVEREEMIEGEKKELGEGEREEMIEGEEEKQTRDDKFKVAVKPKLNILMKRRMMRKDLNKKKKEEESNVKENIKKYINLEVTVTEL